MLTPGQNSPSRLRNAFDNADIALRTIAKSFEGCAVFFRIVCRKRLLKTVELDDDHALVHARFICLCRRSTDNEPAAGCLHRGTSELRVCRECILVLDRAIRDSNTP